MIQRGYSLNQKDFLEKIMINSEPEFFNYDEEYRSDNLDLHKVSNVLTRLDRILSFIKFNTYFVNTKLF